MDSSLTGLDMLGAFQWLGARQHEVCSFVALWHGWFLHFVNLPLDAIRGWLLMT